jgi:hypothetical protein
MRWLTFVLFSIALVLLVVAPVLALLTGIDILRPMLLQYSEVAFVVAVPILLGYLVNHMVLNIIVKRFVIGVALVTTASLIIIGFSVIVGLPSYIGQIKVYETVTLQDYMKIIWHFVLELAPY